MELILIIAGLGMAIGAGAIANSKGRSAIGYFLLGLFLPIVGILVAIGMTPLTSTPATMAPSGKDLVLCRSCRRPHRADAIKCPNCGVGQPQPHEGEKKCPACAEWILAEARKCKHCGEAV